MVPVGAQQPEGCLVLRHKTTLELPYHLPYTGTVICQRLRSPAALNRSEYRDQATDSHNICYPRVNPPTASPAPSTSRSSSSILLILTPDLGIGLRTGLARPIEALNVGLDVMLTGWEM